MKKRADTTPPVIKLKENPDILAALAKDGKARPALVIGFAAETGGDIVKIAAEKKRRKNCDWILANDVAGVEKIFGADHNHVYLITDTDRLEWRGAKSEIAALLAGRIAQHFETEGRSHAAGRRRKNRH
jgi:phosphopantothenoylcysteine decarboxylase/phosphopantothenate--cysteine ligase